MTLGQRIQQIRIEHGLSQEEFAEKLGTTRQTISRWELDQTFPEIAKIVMISKIFHSPPCRQTGHKRRPEGSQCPPLDRGDEQHQGLRGRNDSTGGGLSMKSIIRELWYGNVSPQEGNRTDTKEMKELLGYMARHRQALMSVMTDEQKAIFQKLDNCWSEYASLAEEELFTYAFRLGARIILDAVSEEGVR